MSLDPFTVPIIVHSVTCYKVKKTCFYILCANVEEIIYSHLQKLGSFFHLSHPLASFIALKILR